MNIIPHLWFDNQAAEAVTFYTDLLKDSAIHWKYVLKGTPSGDCDLIEFELVGQTFAAISAGPYFQLDEAISLMLTCQTKDEIDRLYQAFMTNGGEVMMPLQEYPFNPYYAWVKDQYGLTWQLMLDESQENTYQLDYSLLFAAEACGKAEAALKHYAKTFKTAEPVLAYYQDGQANDPRAKIAYGAISLDESCLVAMDHGYTGDKLFSEAFSFMIYCQNQEELDYYYEQLSVVPEAEICGWAKDQFGVSWQIVPDWLMGLYDQDDEKKLKDVQEKIMSCKRIDYDFLTKD